MRAWPAHPAWYRRSVLWLAALAVGAPLMLILLTRYLLGDFWSWFHIVCMLASPMTFPLGVASLKAKWERRRWSDHCVFCGYDVGRSPSPECPECGAKDPLPPPPDPF